MKHLVPLQVQYLLHVRSEESSECHLQNEEDKDIILHLEHELQSPKKSMLVCFLFSALQKSFMSMVVWYWYSALSGNPEKWARCSSLASVERLQFIRVQNYKPPSSVSWLYLQLLKTWILHVPWDLWESCMAVFGMLQIVLFRAEAHHIYPGSSYPFPPANMVEHIKVGRMKRRKILEESSTGISS